MELDSDNEVSIVIPNEIAAQIRSGVYNIILEPIPDGGVGAPISYTIRSFPNTEVHSQSVPHPEESSKTNDPELEEENLEQDKGDTTESDTESSTAKRKGVGSSHRGGKVQKYDLWMRIGFTSAVRVAGLSMKEACEKFKAPRRRAR